jgi:branched-chain amino acid transport system permease protein
MFQILNTFLIGITAGSIYALMAISMVLVWRSTRVINFAQAGMALLSTYFGYEIVNRFDSYWLALPVAMLSGAVVAAFIELVFMRVLLKHSSSGPIASIAPIIATLGLLGIIKAFIGFIWGNQDLNIESPLSTVGFSIGTQTLALSPMKLLILIAVSILLLALTFVFQKTNIGLALRASAYAPEISRLAGIKVDLVRTFGWALAGAAGGAAGMLQTANGNGALSPDSLEFSLLLAFGFIAAVIGGLDSLLGAVFGALLLGLVLAFVLTYVGGSLVFITAFVLLLVVLIIRPGGIISQKAGRRA